MSLTDLAMRIIISADDKTEPGLRNARERIQSISDQLQKVETFAKRVLDIRLFAGWAQDAARLSDSYKTLQARLQLVSDSTQEFNLAQTELFGVAQRTRSSLESTYTMYGKLETVIKQLGGTQQQAIATTETLNQAIALTSQGAQQDTAAILQFSQALGSGVLRGDEFNSVMESSPGLAQALADGLDVPITKLRDMAEAGQLTADRLVNALGKAAPQVAEQFSKLPVTIGGAITQVNNAMLQFVGQSNNINTAVSVVSGALQGLANHFNSIANIAVLLGTVYLGRVVDGWLKSATAMATASQAAAAKAVADKAARDAAIALAQAEAQKAQSGLQAAKAAMEESRVQRALATSYWESVGAVQRLRAATDQYYAAVNIAAAKQTALDNAVGGSSGKLKGFAGLLEKLRGLVSKAFIVTISVGAISSFLEKLGESNEKIRIFSFAWQAAIDKVTATMGHFFSLDFLPGGTPLSQKLDEIDQKYSDMAVNSTDAARKIQQAEQQKAQAAEQGALQQQAAFKQVQDATKALTAQLDADAKAQTAALQQGLTDKLAVIEISNQLDSIRDRQKLAAQLQAAQAETAIVQQTAAQKLALIDAEYQKELQGAAANAQRTKEIETEKRQAKLSVYQGLAEYYQGEVSRLSQIYAQENQAAQQSRNGLSQLEANYEKGLFDLKVKGMADRQALQTQEAEFRRQIQAAQQEYDKGELADKEKLNTALNRAKELHGEIASAAGTGSNAIFEARGRMQKIFLLEKSVLQDNVKAHEANAKGAKQAVDDAASNLKTVRDSITDIAEKLNRDYMMKIGIDQASLAAAQQIIANLTKPETKIITVQTVNAGGVASAQATGGLAGQPTGQPWRFSSGGWARMSGLLSGYGGGDRRKALLEDGEFVVRKEAVQKLGVPVLQAINQGQLPIQRALGGSVGDAVDATIKKDVLEQIKRLLQMRQAMASNYYGSGLGGSTLFAERVAQQSIDKPLTALMRQLDSDTSAQVRELLAYVPKLRVYRNANKLTSSVGDNFIDQQQETAAKRDQTVFDALLSSLGKTPLSGLSAKIERAPVFSVPSIPSINLPSVGLPTSAQAAQVGQTVRVRFEAPSGDAVNARFASQMDVQKMLDVLKQSGATVGVV